MLNENRGWCIPRKNWVMQQSWKDAFFLNSTVDIEELKQFVPEGLNIDTFDGKAWVSLIPFRMKDVKFKVLPFFKFRTFPEVNLRTYVVKDGRPGVLFLSLDSNHFSFNRLVRLVCNIPYVNAENEYKDEDAVSVISSKRDGMELELTVEKVGDSFYPHKESFEFWISERYCFYSEERGRICRWDVDHVPWLLQKAHVRSFKYSNNQIKLNQAELLSNVHYSEGVVTRSWFPD